MKPLRDKILIKPLEEKASSLIVIPDNQEAPEQGEVVAIGPQVSEVKVGDKIIFNKYSLIEVRDLYLISEEDVLATI